MMPEVTTLIPHTTAGEIASVYASATARIETLTRELGAEFARLESAFAFQAPTYGAFEYRIQVGSNSHHTVKCDDKGIAEMLRNFKQAAWQVLVGKLQIEKLMSGDRRRKLRDQLRGERDSEPLPDIDENTIMDVLRGFVADAPSFLEESIRETYRWLIPHRDYGAGVYKTNKRDRVGRKVILKCVADTWSNVPRLDSRMIGQITALDSVFHSLDGKGIVEGQNGPLTHAMQETKTGKGETAYFRFSMCKNRNAHIEFLRSDLLDLFNRVAADGHTLADARK